MNGILLINAYTHSEHELNQPKRLYEEFARLGVQTKIVRNSPLALKEDADFCVFFDKDKYAAQTIGKRMRLFNRAQAIEVCDDKMLTYLALDGFPMPETIPSLLCYYPQEPIPTGLYDAVEALGYPVVVKECHGSLGRQVYLARDRVELEALAQRLKTVPHLYQRFIAESAGRDLRVIVVGGKVVAAMERISETDFRSNIGLGGRGQKFAPDAETVRLCGQIAERLDLDYCGIDLLFGKDGMLVCEVNSNAFFGGIEAVTGVNVAKYYAEHIVSEMKRRK